MCAQAGAPCPHSLPVQLLMKVRGTCVRIIAQTRVFYVENFGNMARRR
jgi:hypothetical protein